MIQRRALLASGLAMVITRATAGVASAAAAGAAGAVLPVRALAGGRDTLPDAPAQAFRAGQWQRAAELAAALGTADGYALAARSRLAPVLLAGALRAPPAAVQAALADARSAIRLDPHHADGRLQLATALGVEARRMPAPVALARQLPQQIRTLVSEVIAADPGNGWASALLAGWHLEGVRLGGAAAATLLGADLAQGRMLFRRAAQQVPADPVIPFHQCAALLALDRAELEAEARMALDQARDRTATDAFQREIARRARQLDLAWARAGAPACRALVLGWL